MVLQRAGNDFRRRGRTGIDQHDDGQARSDIATEDRFRIVSDVLAPRTAALRNDASLGQEQVRQGNRLVKRTTGIRAQIEHQTGNPPAGFALERLPGREHVATDIARELIDHDVADVALVQLPGNRFELDHAAGHIEIEGFVASRAEYCQLDRRAFASAHLRHRFVESLADDQPTVEMGDEVTRLDAHLVGRAPPEGRDHLDCAIFGHDRQAETRIIAVDHRFEPLQIAAVEIPRVRIERGQHAVDHATHERLVLDRFDVTGLDALIDRQHLGELRPGAAFDLC